MSANQKFIEKPRLQAGDLAKRWGLSRKTIYNWTESGLLPGQHRIGTVEFWTEDQIEAWEAENIHQAKPVSETAETQQAS